jgi:hypothetical protein
MLSSVALTNLLGRKFLFLSQVKCDYVKSDVKSG